MGVQLAPGRYATIDSRGSMFGSRPTTSTFEIETIQTARPASDGSEDGGCDQVSPSPRDGVIHDPAGHLISRKVRTLW
jgi:hypothetical protein